MQNSSFSWGHSLQVNIQPKEKSLLTELQINKTLPKKGFAPKSVDINFSNLKFKFDAYTPLVENIQSTVLSSVLPAPKNNGLLLLFSKQVIITFQTSKLNSKELAITIKSFGPKKIIIPFTPNFGTKIKQENHGIKISISKKHYSLIPAFNSSIKKINNKWMLIINDSYALFRLSEHTQNSIPTLTEIPQIIPVQNFKMVFNNFLDRAYNGWLTTRYELASGQWLQPEGIYRFDENLLVAVYAEANRRNELAKHRFTIQRAAILNQEMLTWQTAPIMGTSPDIVLPQYIKQQKELEYTLIDAMQENKLDVFLNLNLLELAYIHFSETIKQKLFSYVQSLSSIDVDIKTAISLLYQSEKTHWQDMATIIRKKKRELIQIILQNIVVANDGYMLHSKTNEISVMYTIISGLYLSRFAIQNNEKNLGLRMIGTALQLADNNGILPRIYLKKDKQFIAMGHINPEEIYPFIIDNLVYPKITFAENIYSISNVPITIKKSTASEIQVTIENTSPNITHYIYLWPVVRTTRVFAFGTYWRGKYNLDSLLQGISYNRTLKSLLIKQKSKKPQETIYLRF